MNSVWFSARMYFDIKISNHSIGERIFLVALYFFAVTAVLVTSQVLHLEGFNPPSVNFCELHGVRSFMQVTDPRIQFTVCAIDAPSQTMVAVGQHGACLEACMRNPPCVAYNFNFATTQCDLFNNVPKQYEYNKNCVNFRVRNLKFVKNQMVENIVDKFVIYAWALRCKNVWLMMLTAKKKLE